jgi:hypothetical protein
MPGPIRLFVSSSPELQLEREVVGQVAAQLPLTLGWQIDHTPMPGELATDNLARVSASDLYVVLLGHDFAAPMGAELRHAHRLDKHPIAYRRQCTLSPSSQDAVRTSGVEWRVFSALDTLRAWITRDMLRSLLQKATALGLDLGELERLLKLAEEKSAELEGDRGLHGRRGEAGHSGIILGREVWEDGP